MREGSINQEEGLQLVQLADSQLLQVQQALAVDDKTTARASLSEAQRYLDEAIVLIGVTDQIQELSEVITTELQELLQVRALYSLDVPLLEYATDAEPHRIVVSDQDIYMLDSGRQSIAHYRTNPERTLLEEDNGAILKRRGHCLGSHCRQVGRYRLATPHCRFCGQGQPSCSGPQQQCLPLQSPGRGDASGTQRTEFSRKRWAVGNLQWPPVPG